MAGYFGDLVKKQLADLQTRAQTVADEVSREVGREADSYAFKIVTPALRAAAETYFHDAAAQWYSAYSPVKYQRGWSLYDTMRITDPGEGGVGWLSDDSALNKPSWGGGTYNIYGLVFEGGHHGGPVHGRIAASSTPIPTIFETSMEENVYPDIQEQIYQLGQQYYEEHFAPRFEQRFYL